MLIQLYSIFFDPKAKYEWWHLAMIRATYDLLKNTMSFPPPGEGDIKNPGPCTRQLYVLDLTCCALCTQNIHYTHRQIVKINIWMPNCGVYFPVSLYEGSWFTLVTRSSSFGKMNIWMPNCEVFIINETNSPLYQGTPHFVKKNHSKTKLLSLHFNLLSVNEPDPPL